LWNRVQRILASNRHERRNGNTVRYPSLLTGLLLDPDGRPMTPVFTSRGSRRHHYYVTRLNAGADPKSAWRVPAGEVDRAVIMTVATALRAPGSGAGDTSDIEQQQALADDLLEMSVPERRGALHELGVAAFIEVDAVRVTIGAEDQKTCSLPARLVHRGIEKRLVIGAGEGPCEPDPVLLKLVALGSLVLRCTVTGKSDSLVDHYSKRHRWQLLRIAFLAPDIIAAIVAGRQPVTLTGRRLLRATDIPLDWAAQRQTFGFD
jgi:hypothetical protein